MDFIVTNNSATLTLNGTTRTITSSQENFGEVCQAISRKQYREAFKLMSILGALEDYSQGFVDVKDGVVKINGVPTHGVVTDRILQFMKDNKPFKPIVNFLNRAANNPSIESIGQLYRFLEHKNIPLTERGTFLAYKYLNEDYTSVHADPKGNYLDNSIGKVVRMPRCQVENNPEKECGAGLHAGTLEYVKNATSDGTKIVVVEVDPEHVVSIPADSNCQKMRVCQYTVVDDHREALNGTLYKTLSRPRKNTTEKILKVMKKWNPFSKKPKRDKYGRFSTKSVKSKKKKLGK